MRNRYSLPFVRTAHTENCIQYTDYIRHKLYYTRNSLLSLTALINSHTQLKLDPSFNRTTITIRQRIMIKNDAKAERRWYALEFFKEQKDTQGPGVVMCGLLRVRRAARPRCSSPTVYPLRWLSEELRETMLFWSDRDCREQRKGREGMVRARECWALPSIIALYVQAHAADVRQQRTHE